jgi:hypothetical protein
VSDNVINLDDFKKSGTAEQATGGFALEEAILAAASEADLEGALLATEDIDEDEEALEVEIIQPRNPVLAAALDKGVAAGKTMEARVQKLEAAMHVTQQLMAMRDQWGNSVGTSVTALERFCYIQLKLLLDKGIITAEELGAAEDEFLQHNNLRDFLGFGAPPEEDVDAVVAEAVESVASTLVEGEFIEEPFVEEPPVETPEVPSEEVTGE